ncbi:anti-repressor protein [Anaerosporobacter mobilis DSM 15930]|uniref:Anti-repressor protein n=1 Tax=Anaerosporobacter mobilis DSM 15930 TaxID=1120996 RepID=A0A1M7NI43_9FIRM|nr:antA/AntB antirepressor family protein [Anaerosporobacter mobilis]SHN03343.1 anti-repressor protein [Anaerosporobacter mobilis DSM 15930]
MNDLLTITNQTPIEIALGIDEKGMTTAKKLYDFLELDRSNYSRWFKKNIEENEYFEENTDWIGFVTVTNGNETKDAKITTDFAKHLSMESHSYKGKDARNYFIGVEDKLKEVVISTSELPPELQMFKSIFDQQAKQYIELQKMKEDNQKIEQKVDAIREVVSLDTTSWREDTGKLLRKIAQQRDGGAAYSEVRAESYDLLNKRFGVDVKTRLTNKRRRMAEEGVCKSKRDKLSYLDVIAEDKKLIEGYVAIVKDMAIKYGCSL